MLQLNLGCGTNKKQDCVNVDKSNLVHPDVVLDLAKSILPWGDSEVDKIHAIDLIEHIQDPIPFMNECWRVLKAGGKMEIETPYAGTDDFYKDPTHVRGYVPNTFKYFAEWNTCPAYEIKSWIIERLDWTKGGENRNRIYVTMRPNKNA